MQKRGIVILLLIGLIAPVASTFLWIHVQKKSVKRAIKWRMISGIDREDLVEIKLSNAEAHASLQWKHSKEFSYHGQFYDIVETKQTLDSVTYWCWWDHEETKLHKQLMGLVELALGGDPLKNEKETQLLRFFQSLYCTTCTDVAWIEMTYAPPRLAIWDHVVRNRRTRPPTPPPRTA